jgi:hypothetical protein
MISTAEKDMLDLNVAPTTVAADTVTLQTPVPPHAPVQPVNVEPVAGVAVRVTGVPLATGSEQSVPQPIPGPVTVPVPVPPFTTVSVEVATPVTFEVMRLVAVPVPVPAPATVVRLDADGLLLPLAVRLVVALPGAFTAALMAPWISLPDSARL